MRVNRFCKDRSKVDECLANVTNYYTPCFDEKERNSFNIYYNFSSKSFDVSCFNNGERLLSALRDSNCTSESIQNFQQKCGRSQLSDEIPLVYDKDKCE